MSIVADQVRRLDARVDRILLSPFINLEEASNESDRAEDDEGVHVSKAVGAFSTPRVNELLRIVRGLSVSASSHPVLPPWQIQSLLSQSGLLTIRPQAANEPKNEYETEIEWLLVSKATAQTYGAVMDTLLNQIIPLSDEIWYWDEVLSSYTYSSLYTVQTSPLRWWTWSKEIIQESKERVRHLQRGQVGILQSGDKGPPLSQRWRQFYSIVRESIFERSVIDLQRRLLSPVALCRAEARHKQSQLKKLREITASGLGVLIDEGLSVDEDAKGSASARTAKWKGVVERSVALMDMVLKDVRSLDTKVSDFEDHVFTGVEEDSELSIHAEDPQALEKPTLLAQRLQTILRQSIPHHVSETRVLVKENGRPSRWVRYWLPAGILLVSSSTILRVLVHRRDDILDWIRNLGATVSDFWFNWVVDPVRRLVATIRHDEASEIAIMSRDSLKADRESLERMVVDFATDKPAISTGSSAVTDAQLADIRAKVKEGDVTPVLKAYEKDLRRPFVGAVKGDLVRALLIQVQKTKVDLEVAISGIDSLLKSQELVFGFVSLTPGVLISIGVLQYLRGVLGGRKGLDKDQRAKRSIRVLRNIDRIFSEAAPSQNNVLPYKDHGLLICEVHVLRKLAHGLLPHEVEKDFLEDVGDLANTQGIQVQVGAFKRIRWAYAKWLN